VDIKRKVEVRRMKDEEKQGKGGDFRVSGTDLNG